MRAALPVRRLLIDLRAPIDRRWAGGDAFRTAFFNALSMSFPAGEQFFIETVRAGLAAMPPADQARWAAEVQGFAGQEATHRHVHGQFNAHVASQGHVNTWEQRIRDRQPLLAGKDLRHALAITAAFEHFTAVLSDYLLAHPACLDGAEPRLRLLWEWHAAEESEHRHLAFDVYRALGGNLRWRRRWFFTTSLQFFADMARQMLRNLAHDGSLLRGNTWRSAAAFLFGRAGLVPAVFGPWRAYLAADFHPAAQGGERGAAWLREHGADVAVVSAPPRT